MNILEAIRDPSLFRPFFGDDLRTWRPWMAALKVLYGLRPFSPSERKLIQKCTGRDPDKLPREGFTSALFLVGRRSGKSRIASLVGAYEAALAGHETRLAKGERGLVICCAPTKAQSAVEKRYIASIFEPPLLAAEVVRETMNGFDLASGISIEILQADYKTVRNFTSCAVVISETAFFGIEEGTKVKSDTELVRALQPGLATTGGKLIAISSPYAKRGWCYRTWKSNFGNDKGKTLVWNTDSMTMNPTLPQSVVDAAMEEDRAAALSEYGGQFRDDVILFVPREAVERLVRPGRVEILPRLSSGWKYNAFADLSGGRHDDSALAIAHKNSDGAIILDRVVRWAADGSSPYDVVAAMAKELTRYGLKSVTGDNYAADFVAQSFRAAGIRFTKSTQSKSELYRELLPRLFGDELELLDDAVLVEQLSNLERRTRSGGKDVIDHPQGQKDDVANAVAGAVVSCTRKVIRIGAF